MLCELTHCAVTLQQLSITATARLKLEDNMHPNMTKTLTEMTQHPDSPGVSTGRFRGWFKAAFLRWHRNRTTKALQNLDDRTLADIGLCRNDIPLMVEKLTERELRMTPLARPTVAQDDMQMAA